MPLIAFPIDDWQFWVVTLAALGSVFLIAWRILGAKLRRRRGGQSKRRAALTIEGDPVTAGRKEENRARRKTEGPH